MLLPLLVPVVSGPFGVPALLLSACEIVTEVSIVNLFPSERAPLAVIDRFKDFLTTAGKCVTAFDATDTSANPNAGLAVTLVI